MERWQDAPATMHMTPSTQLDYSAPATQSSSRLTSLDAFRGLVILAMLIVNNLGDYSTTGYFWKHADWVSDFGGAWKQWIAAPSWSRIPLFVHCTLADYVMPCFILIIGVAIPFSAAASHARGVPPATMWIRTVRRSAVLVLLGWILCYFRDHFAKSLYGEAPWTFPLGMDVLQLLGVSYLVARVLYELPQTWRVTALVALYLCHWAILRFYPQGDFPAGTFTEKHNAIKYIYDTWPVWKATTLHAGPVTIGWIGMLSVSPTVATMLLGTLMGDRLRRGDIPPPVKARGLAWWGLILAVIGFVWAFDLPFNKPRWTPCYMIYVSGVGAMLIALLYWVIDIRKLRRWCHPLVVFGCNAIGVYFLSILLKVLLLNTPRLTLDGKSDRLINHLMIALKQSLGAWAGGWTFTIVFVLFWYGVLEIAYRKKIFWKV